MKTHFLGVMLFIMTFHAYAQEKTFWKEAAEPPQQKQVQTARIKPSSYKTFELNIDGLRGELAQAPSRENASGRSAGLLMKFPTPEGKLEQFRVVEASIMHPDLAAKFPTIKSYAGQGIDDPTATIRFSVSDQKGFHGMILSADRSSWFIDPYSTDQRTYQVYSRKSLPQIEQAFMCHTESLIGPITPVRENTAGKTNDKKLRKYRLALSCNAEYGNIFAGTTGTDAQKKANIMAQMTITMTRVNGVYERDLAILMEFVPNNDLIIYYGSTSADPWNGEFNNKTQQVIDAAIGSANYDIGHNFNTSGGGNAGCIACVCVNGDKGSGYTGRPNPTGDAFDIDYVAHEMGHQFGGFHTQASSVCISGSGLTEVEPGSGSTIMGYAGICVPNIQSNSDAYFHYVNIRDISANIQTGTSSGCAQVVTLVNNPPTANAGLDYTIPRSTAFVLHGTGSDPDGDALTYCWEQNDPQPLGSANSSPPTPTRTSGPVFRSFEGTSSPDRYFPRIQDVIAGNLAPTWEVIPSVARTLNFALTVRDNHAGGGQTSDDLMVVIVSGSAGPFTVSAPNTAVTWAIGSTQTVTWSVASTNVAPVSCANVNIKLSTDGGFTYPITLASNTPNDGSQAITVPNNPSTSCRVKVEAAGNIFYDISNVNFTISGGTTCTATVPTGLAASGITASSASLSWSAVSGATYDVRYRVSGTTTWTTVAASSNSTTLTGLTALTNYEAQVRSNCPSSSSAYSASITFATLGTSVTYCASKGNIVTDEYIGRVQLGTINNVSGPNGGYGNFTALSTTLTKGSPYTITVTPVWTSTVYTEAYSAWIDYNQDGDFTDAGEQVWTRAATTTTPVSGSFTVPAGALSGATRMRVSMRYSTIPSPCGNFQYGEVEDYTVNISSSACSNVTLTLVLDNYPEETSWTIKNSSGTTLFSGGTYGTSPDGSTVTVVNCIAPGCYTFTINDTFGDGICCAFGSGSYTLTQGSTTLASGGTFGFSQSHNICVTASKTDRGDEFAEMTTDRTFDVFPNPASDKLNITVDEQANIRQMVITTMNGMHIRAVQKEERVIDISSMAAGMYIFSVETDKAVIRKKFIKE